MLQGVAELHREVFTALTRYCERHDDFLDETIRRFDREVQLNLHERLVPKGEPVCFALPALASGGALSARGLYDVCLSLSVDAGVVGNRPARRVLTMMAGER